MENNLPHSWAFAKVDEVAFTASGGTPSTSKKEYWEKGNVPWMNSGTLKDNLITKPSHFITELGLKNSSAKLFPKHSIVIALTGATTGRVGILDFDCSANQSVTALYPSKFNNFKFLFYFLLASRDEVVGMSLGSAQPHINKFIVDNLKVPIPPLSEQQRIVSKLDLLFEKLESNKQRLEKVSLIEYQIFLKNIYNGLEFYDTVKLEDYCLEQTERIGNNWKNFRLIGVSKDEGVVDLRVGGKKTFEKYKIVKPGWFLYNPMRVDIGSITIWDGKENAITSPDYVVFSIKHSLSPLMLLKFLKSSYGLSEINNNTQGAVRSRLYYRNLAEINFPFSNVEKHAEAELLFIGFNKLNQKKDLLKKIFEKLRQSILAKAFRGELVPQNPNDEPASVLLERIKKEKEKMNVEKKGKGKKDRRI